MSQNQRQQSEISADVEAIVDEARQKRQKRKTAAQLKKAARATERVRLRLDIPQWLKDTLGQAAKEQGASMNQLGAFLLTYALTLYQDRDADLLDAMESVKTSPRSITFAHGFVLEGMRDALTKSAKPPY